MTIERFYLACLSHASYIVSSGSEAAVIDPQRDVTIYLDYLQVHGLTLKYVVETHLHADFVSGHLELAHLTGAEVVMGSRAGATFTHLAVHDGDILPLGTASLSMLETPGHTPEGITIAATDAATPDEPIALFTGDTLFAGDVGRPDLLGGFGVTKEELGGMLYDSLHEKILTMPDETRVYPAHGAGSSCGKALRDVEFTTLGAERLTNYALQPMSRDEFIRAVTEGQPEAPAYFASDAMINRAGAPALGNVMDRVRPLDPAEFRSEMGWGAVLLDTRGTDDFAAGHIPGAYNIGLDGQFATWVGTLLPIHEPLVIVADHGREAESVMRCARVGYDNIVGFLAGGMEAWSASGGEVQTFDRIRPADLAAEMASNHPPIVIDVRREAEREAKHIPGTTFVTLSQLENFVTSIVADGRPVVVHCAAGYRSAMAVSILQHGGVASVRDLAGGLAAWESAGQPVDYHQPQSLLDSSEVALEPAG
ncbi:MAG: MBL fold metallo-hydrolase [Bacteroidetes bacterium]|nr:MBL fold metallo-hydrolase [Bacteroidota bacterium]